MPQIRANGLTFEVEDTGPRDGPPLLMIMGLAAQMIFWPDALLDALRKQGFRIVRFDNRDVGLSAKLHGTRAPHPVLHMAARMAGFRPSTPYTLHDMAADAEGVLDALKIDRAHLVGVSMGGMIAQLMAGTRPARVASLTSIMSSTLNPRLPRLSARLSRAMFMSRPRGTGRDDLIAHAVNMYGLIRSKDPADDGRELRAKITAAFERGFYPQGVRRQVAAIVATGDLRPHLRKIAAPTLVIHGAEDPLVPVAAGLDSAHTIPNARIEIIEGMAHDLPKRHLTHIADLITAHVKAAV